VTDKRIYTFILESVTQELYMNFGVSYLLLIVAEMSSHTVLVASHNEIPVTVQWRFGHILGDSKTGNYESCSEMIETRLECRLKDDDSHITTL
jgi:hypothetical protein